MDLYRTLDFGKIDYHKTGRKINVVNLEVALKNADTDKPAFTVSGKVWNSKHTDIHAGGQCLDTVKPYFKHNKLYNLIEDLWEKYHLNDMNAGTPEQEKCLKEHEDERETIANEYAKALWEKARIEYGYSDNYYKKWIENCLRDIHGYTLDCIVLKTYGMYEVEVNGKPYQYGHSWLYRAIPEKDLAKIRKILDPNNSVESLYKMSELYD